MLVNEFLIIKDNSFLQKNNVNSASHTGISLIPWLSVAYHGKSLSFLMTDE